MINALPNLLNGPMLKVSFVLLILGTLIMAFVSKLRKLLAKNKFKVLLYVVSLLGVFALTGLLSSPKILNDVPLNSFIGAEIIFFCLGIGHLFVMRIHFKELSEKKDDFLMEFLFTLFMIVLALLAFVNVVGLYRQELSVVFMSAGIAFVIPFLVLKMYEFVTLIPAPIYQKWYFPIGQDIKDPEGKELANPLVISLEFNKQKTDQEISRFKLKAPEGMEFGKLFYFFVDDYNDLHPEGQIMVSDRTGTASGWIFYFKPNWWSSVCYIDAKRTVEWNGIKEENTIIAQRV